MTSVTISLISFLLSASHTDLSEVVSEGIMLARPEFRVEVLAENIENPIGDGAPVAWKIGESTMAQRSQAPDRLGCFVILLKSSIKLGDGVYQS